MTWLALEPLDTVAIGDGRGSDAALSVVAPLPSTVGGAVGAAVGGEIDHHLIGPFLSSNRELQFICPRDIIKDEYDDVSRLTARTLSTNEVTDISGSLDTILVGDGEYVDGLLTVEAMTEWLHGDGHLIPGGVPRSRWWRTNHHQSPWSHESRIGLTLHAERDQRKTVVAGMLYSGSHLRPVDGTQLLVGCVTDAELEVQRSLVNFGGRGRRAAVSIVDPPSMPTPPTTFPDGHVAVYLVTPALVDDVYWCPRGARLRAIALAGPQPVATASRKGRFWDSRRMSWAAPAGTVFYLEFGDADNAADWVSTHVGKLLPGQTPGLRMVNAGFGTFFAGRW